MRITKRGLRGKTTNVLAVSESFRAFVLDQLEELGNVLPRSMFGGVGLYRNGLFFGIIAGDVLYLKADDRTRAVFEAAGSQPFKPYPDRGGTMKYFSVPISVLESPPDLARWARLAVAAATRAADTPPISRKRTK
jgi:DNA transformation protein